MTKRDFQAGEYAAEAATDSTRPEPDAWGVIVDGRCESVAHRRFKESADQSAEHLGGTVVHLRRFPTLNDGERTFLVALRDWHAQRCLEKGREEKQGEARWEGSIVRQLDAIIDKTGGRP